MQNFSARIGTLSCALLLAGTAFAQSKIISTIAGVPWRFPTTPLQAINAPMGEVEGTALDASGNLYICDPSDEYAMKITPAGALTIIAGNGVIGTSGDGGPATSASLDNPFRITVGPAGYIYISEQNKIRAVSPGGIISTFAGNGLNGFAGDGGLAPDATLSSPKGVVVDAAGNVYIADSLNNRIRVVTAGVITTYAGNGTAGFSGDGGAAVNAMLNHPDGLAVDSAGNLYIADTDNAVIRKVTVGTGIITTVAGTNVAGFAGDGGAATAAQLNSPTGVAIDSSGNLFIADQFNYRVREVSSGTISTVAGNGALDYTGDGGPATGAALARPVTLAVDNSDNLFIAELNSARIRLVSGGTISTFAGNGEYYFTGDGGLAVSAALGYVNAVATDGSGNVFVSAQNRVREISSGVITTVAGSDRGVGNSGDGGAANNATMDFPQGIAVDGAANLFIADTFNDRIREVTGGVINTVVGYNVPGCFGDGGRASSATVDGPRDVAVDANGNYYIADSSNNAIRKVDINGNISTFAGQCFTQGFGGDGGPATLALLYYPTGMAFDAAGNLYFADQNNKRVRKVTPGGIISTVAGSGASGYSGDGGLATAASLNLPQGVAVDSDGEIFIADTANNVIRKVVPQGIISTVVGNGVAGFSGDGGAAENASLTGPTSIAITGPYLIVADSGNVRVRQVSGTVNYNISDPNTYVNQLYLDLLSRPADPNGLAYWTGKLNSGTLSRGQVAQDFFTSPEFYSTGLLVIKDYIAALGRDPDYTGWIYWFSQLQTGAQTSDQVLTAFLNSAEFQSTYGSLNNTQFVTLVYQNVLQRQPDQAGLNYWVGQLNAGKTREYVMSQFINSSEFNALVTNRALANLLYMGFLRRTADPSGLSYWEGQLDAGVSQASAINGFITSPEYLARF